jgi:hypothetical protein
MPEDRHGSTDSQRARREGNPQSLHASSKIFDINVVTTLERITQSHGYLKPIKVDNGPEFISKDLDRWAYWNKVELDFSRPGKPADNALVEACNFGT